MLQLGRMGTPEDITVTYPPTLAPRTWMLSFT
jgi:hypothetical protein